jgi:hypothetical protein
MRELQCNMSLNVYRKLEDIPIGMKYIKSNDMFFDSETIIGDSKFEKNIISTIDGAEYVSENVFKSRFAEYGNLDKLHLSTGSKTALNIYQNPNICFDVCECGNNVLSLIIKLNNGNILWKNPILIYDGDELCDITMEGRHYTNIYVFLKNTMGH